MSLPRPTRSQWCCLAGFTCYWGWTFCVLLTNVFSPRAGAQGSVDVWLVSTVFHMATLLALGALSGRVGSYLRSALAVALAPSACLAGFLLIVAADSFGADAVLVAAAGAALAGVGTGLVVVLWAELFVACCKGYAMVALLFVGVTTAAAVGLVLALLPRALSLVVLVALPVASVAAIYGGARGRRLPTATAAASVRSVVSWRFVAFCLVFPIPLGLFQTWFHTDSMTLARWMPIFAASIALLLVVAALDRALFRARRFSLAEKLIMPVTVAGLFFLVSFDTGATLVGGILVFTAQQIMSVVLYARFGQIAAREEIAPAKVFALGISATDCGFIAGIAAANLMPPATSGHGLYLVLGIVYLVVIAAFLNAGGLARKVEPVSATAEGNDSGAVPTAGVAAVASAHGLTPRESEILEYLLRGKSVPAVAAEVLLSVNTVRTHIAHIYQKFDVHSRDELVAVVEKALESA